MVVCGFSLCFGVCWWCILSAITLLLCLVCLLYGWLLWWFVWCCGVLLVVMFDLSGLRLLCCFLLPFFWFVVFVVFWGKRVGCVFALMLVSR